MGDVLDAIGPVTFVVGVGLPIGKVVALTPTASGCGVDVICSQPAPPADTQPVVVVSGVTAALPKTVVSDRPEELAYGRESP